MELMDCVPLFLLGTRVKKIYVKLSLHIIEQKEHFMMVKPASFFEIVVYYYFHCALSFL